MTEEFSASSLPLGWSVKKVGDYAELLRGVNYDKSEVESSAKKGYSPILRANNIQEEITFDDLVFVKNSRIGANQHLRKGDILICMSSGSKDLVGKAAQITADFNGGFGAFCGLLRPNDKIDHDFLALFFRSRKYRQLVSACSKGTNINNLKRQHILEIDLPFPPLSVQTEIVRKVGELFNKLDSGISNLVKIENQLELYKQSILKAAFNGSLSENWRAQNLSILKQKFKSSGELADLWDTVTVEKACSIIADCPHSTPKWSEDGEICLRTTNFKPGLLDLSEVRRVSNSSYLERIARVAPEPGDILYSREGAILGIACIIPDGLKVCMGQRMMLMRADPKTCNGKFLMYFLNSPSTAKFVKRHTGGTASPHINVRDIKNLPISLPSLNEQLEIVAQIEQRLAVCDQVEKSVNSMRTMAEGLRQSILKSAFDGSINLHNSTAAFTQISNTNLNSVSELIEA